MRKTVSDRILKKFNHKCAYCGSQKNLEVDHIIPLSRGGRHDEDNMQILCRSCNRRKGRGINLRKYFKIGISPDYIEMSRDLPIGSLTPKELVLFVEMMWRENDKVFSPEN